MGVSGTEMGALLSAIPIPNENSLRLLLEALTRLARLEWVAEAEKNGSWPRMFWSEKDPAKLPVGSFSFSAPELTSIRGRYAVYSALIDNRTSPPRWLENARGILVLSAWNWRGNHTTAQGSLASAVRSMQQKGGEETPLAWEFAKLGSAESLAHLFDLAQQLEPAEFTTSKSLADAWTRHFSPFLVKLSEGNSPLEQAEPTPTGGGSDDSKPNFGSAKDRPEKRLRRPRTNQLIAVSAPTTYEERAEAPEDIGTPITVFDVPVAQGASKEQQRIDLLRANQSIWTANTLLLSDHYDCLGWAESEILAKFLAEQVEHAPVDVAIMMACLSLMLATGRTAKSLSKGMILSQPTVLPQQNWVLDLGKSEFWQRVPRPKEAYKPSVKEKSLLHVVSDKLPLKLAQGFVALMVKAVSRGIQVAGSAQEIENDVMAACKLASEDLGMRFTPGRVRRTLSRLLQDSGRDVVKTMLITGDTFGWSQAPLYYTAPQVSDLQELYLRVASSVFGGEIYQIPHSEERVGAQLLRLLDTRRTVTAAAAQKLEFASSMKAGPKRSRAVHNAIVDYLALMLLDTCGHRPTDALFLLLLADFDLEGLSATFQDKSTGPALTTRFVAIPQILVKQIQIYLRHLEALASEVSGDVKKHVLSVFQGGSPLLFKFSDDGSVYKPKISDWSKGLPEACTQLPMNGGRTTIATRGRELGAHPEAILTQLGHLEAVGFPFSDCSPTIPLHLAAELAPVLDAVALEAGWRCLVGLGADMSVQSTTFKTKVWPNWSSKVKLHQSSQQDALRIARDSLRAKSRIARELAREWVRDALQAVAPKLSSALQENAAELSVEVEILDQAAVSRMQSLLLVRADGDAVRAYAAMHALRTRLNFARTKWQWAGYVPYRWQVVRRAEGSPFFPGMMAARAQIEEMRQAFAGMNGKPPADTDPVAWAFARTALALMLFGFVERKDELLGLLGARTKLRRVAKLPTALLAQWSNEPCRVSCLQGLAAISLGALAWHYPANAIPSESTLEQLIQRMLPPGSSKTHDKLLDAILSLVGVTNRIELSGADRAASDPKHGSRDADVDRQVAWLDGEPAVYAPTSAVPSPSQGVAKTRSVSGNESATRQYRRLTSLFPSKVSGSVLPLTGETISPLDIAHSRPRLINELRQFDAAPQTHEVIRALAAWAIHMLEDGTIGTSDPALDTVLNYLTVVGSELVPLLRERRMTRMEESDLSASLIEVVELKRTDNSKYIAAREVKNFYAVAASHLGLPDVDLDELSLYAPSSEEGVDTELVLPTEVDAALSALWADAAQTTAKSRNFTTREIRLLRQAYYCLFIFRATGARSGEVLGSRLRDLQCTLEAIFFRVARNRNRRLKTPAARRRYVLNHRLSQSVHEYVRDWRTAEQHRLPASKQYAAYAISAVGSGRDISVRQTVRDLIADYLAASTGRSAERIHRLRHLVGSEVLVWTFLTPDQRAEVGFLRPLSPTAREVASVLFPRDLACHTVLLGHASPSTTLRVYLHFGWVLRLRSGGWISRWANRRSAAVALGITPAGSDRITQRHRTQSAELAWLNHVVKPRVSPAAIEVPQAMASDVGHAHDIARLKVSDLARILEWTERGAKLSLSGLSAGASSSQLALIKLAADEFRAQTGVNFARGDDKEAGNRAKVRRNSLNQHLYGLLDLLDSTESADQKSKEALMAVANALFARARVRHRDAIVLPAAETALLRRLLDEVGHDQALIETEAVGGGPLQTTRVRRRDGSNVRAGLELKRILGVVWVWERACQLAQLE